VYSKITANVCKSNTWENFSDLIDDVTDLLSLKSEPLWANRYHSEETRIEQLLQLNVDYPKWTAQTKCIKFDILNIIILNNEVEIILSSEMIFNTVGESLTILLDARGIHLDQIHIPQNHDFVTSIVSYVVNYLNQSFQKINKPCISLINFYNIIEDILIEHGAYDVAKILVYKRTLFFQFLPQYNEYNSLLFSIIQGNGEIITLSLKLISENIESHLLELGLDHKVCYTITNAICNFLISKYDNLSTFPAAYGLSIDSILAEIKKGIMRYSTPKQAENYALNQHREVKKLSDMLTIASQQISQNKSDLSHNMERYNLTSEKIHFRNTLTPEEFI